MNVFRTMNNKDPDGDLMDEKLKKNIYGMKTHKPFHIFHYIYKYKFFVPILMLGRKILNGIIVKKIPKKPHNINLWVFDKAYEKAIEKWFIYYKRNHGPANKRKTRAQMIKASKKERYLRTLKELSNTLFMYDTAYREFMNILMHEIAHNMIKEYSKPAYTKDGKQITGHLFYTTDIYEVNYFVLEKAMRYHIDLAVVNSESMLKQQEGKKNDRRKER